MVKNGIVYGKNKPKVLSVVSVTPMHDYRLKVTFSNHEKKIFDFKPYLSVPDFAHLHDTILFNKCYISLGIVTWDEKTEISTDLLYFDGVTLSEITKLEMPDDNL